jgi:ribosome-associated protein
MKKNDIRKQVLLALSAAKDKKAEDIVVLELPQESSAFTDYFLICSGGNPRQVQAIADEVDKRLSQLGFEPNHREGRDQAEWILLDYVDYVVHIFSSKARGFYDLERLWKSAKRLDENGLKAPARKAATKTAGIIKTAGKKTVAKKTVSPRSAAAGKKRAAGKRAGTKAAARKKSPTPVRRRAK